MVWANYCAYDLEHKHKSMYFTHTIKQMDKYLQTIGFVKPSKLTPAIRTQVEPKQHNLLFLSCLYRRLCISILKETVPKEFQNLIKIPKALKNQISGRQSKKIGTQRIWKWEIQENSEESHQIKLDQIGEKMTEDQKKTNKLNQKLESWTWLNQSALRVYGSNYNLQN